MKNKEAAYLIIGWMTLTVIGILAGQAIATHLKGECPPCNCNQ